MEFFLRPSTRRDLFRALAAGTAASLFPDELRRIIESGTYQDLLQSTPAVTEGPFYPDKLPLDQDNDLVIIGNGTTPALGTITHLSGQILDRTGAPLNNVTIEIWQVDGNGVYIHSNSAGKPNEDKNFQGYGRFETDSKGQYRFRTVKPVPYPGRAPHIHFKVLKGERDLLCSQILVAGDVKNSRDGVLRSAGNAEAQKLLLAEFNPMKGSKTGELEANFRIVIGVTPEDNHDH
jgi:protocatechuate 3,4-dioxygenase beta subunit